MRFMLAAMVFACSLCAFQSNTRILLIKHQFSCHSVEPSFRLTCGIQGCSHLFKFGSTFSSFKTHASRKHTNWQQNVEDEESSRDANSTTSTMHDEPVNNPEELRQEQFDHMNDFCQSDGAGNAMLESGMNSEKVAAMFLLTFKERFIISQTALNFAVGSISRLIECAREEGRDGINPFQSLQTEHMQSKFYREELGLVVSNNLYVYALNFRSHACWV